MTPDPGGKAAAHPGDPQTWDMYAYVRNNPTTLNDPTGLEPAPADAQKMAGNESDIAADFNPFWAHGGGPGEQVESEYTYREYLAVALSGALPDAENPTTLGFTGDAVVEMAQATRAQPVPQSNPHNAAIDAAYQLACSHSADKCQHFRPSNFD